MSDFSKESLSILTVLNLFLSAVFFLPPCPAAVDSQSEQKNRASKWVKYTRAAERAIDLNKPEMASKFLIAALRESEIPGQSIYRQVNSLKLLAALQIKQGECKQAVENLKRAISLLQSKPEGPILAECYFLQAEALNKAGRTSEAGQLAEQALEIWQRTLVQKKELVLRLIDLGGQFARMNKYLRAVEIYQMALASSRELGPKSNTLQRACIATLANGSFQLADYYCQNQQWKEAQDMLEKTARLYIEFDGPEQVNLVQVNLQLAQVYKHQGKFDKANEAERESKRIQTANSAKSITAPGGAP